MPGWWDEARSSAAREYGARHYRVFALIAVGRRVIPALMLLAGLAGIVGGLAWTYPWWSQRLGALAVLAVGVMALGLLVWLAIRRLREWRRWRW